MKAAGHLASQSDRALPAGTVTFAFTDIEGSTARWERDPPAMREALRRHDAIVRDAVTAHNGRVFKAMGDAFCTAFARADDAVDAMIAVQRALASQDFSAIGGLRVRTAIHLGTVDERDGDYFGPPVNRVSRLLAIAHGGQILISGVANAAMGDRPPPQTIFLDRGEHRLKDLAQPEHVYQVVAPGLQVDFPPLLSLNVLANNLPLQISSFIGREAEAAEIASLLERHRLVTIVGSGGVGKTRTALQVAANVAERFDDGAWFIELAALTSGDYIVPAIANEMHLPVSSAEGDPLRSLAGVLKTKKALLVFDNCEHIVDAAAHAASVLLKACPQLHIVATSRQSLHVDGEQTYRLPSLVLDQAVELFAERAAAVDHRFRLTEKTLPIIRDVCERLDGIPLAIELAAARVRIFNPQQLRERLNEQFRVLTGGPRTALPRQQTLRAMIDWSYDLLSETEQSVFRRLSIFVDGFSPDAAVVVAGAAEMDEIGVLDVLQSLADKSLLLPASEPDEVRYRLLDSTRAYGREKLEAVGELAQTATRHLHYFRDAFGDVLQQIESVHSRTALRIAASRELQNLRAALTWGLDGDPIAGAELLSVVGTVWHLLSYDREGLDYAQRYLELIPETEPRLKAWLHLVSWQMQVSTERALPAARESLRYARIAGTRFDLANALRAYAWASMLAGNAEEAKKTIAEARAVTPPDAEVLKVTMAGTHGGICVLSGDYAGAIAAFEEVRRSYVAWGDADYIMVTDQNIADAEFMRGNVARAIDVLKTAVESNEHTSFRLGLLMGRIDLCAYLAVAGRVDEAVVVGCDAVRESASQGETSFAAVHAVENLGFVRALQGSCTAAAKIAAYATAAYDRLHREHQQTSKRVRALYESALRERLSEDELAKLFAEGAVLTHEQAAALALM